MRRDTLSAIRLILMLVIVSTTIISSWIRVSHAQDQADHAIDIAREAIEQRDACLRGER